MKSFRNLSIRLKQTLIIMLTSSIALLLACAAFIAYDAITFREELLEKETSVAQVIGNATTAALDFNDQKTAEEFLAALQVEPNIVAACIYNRDGQVFATYQRARQANPLTFPAVQAANHEFTRNHLHLFLPIKQGDELMGTIYIASDLEELSGRLIRYAGIVALVFGASMLIAFAVSRRLQRVVSNPILHLAEVARSVALEKNYAVRATKHSEDELGQLIDGFNEMLTQIQQRDTALQAARENLEHRVADRTKELAESLSLLHATLESTTDGILAVDLSGNITSYNSKFTAIWQMPADLLERRDLKELAAYAAEQVTDKEKFIQRVQASRSEPDREMFDLFELKDGRVFERYALPQRIGTQCMGVVVNWRDITERRRAEEAVRESQALYHSLVEQLPSGVFRKDHAGRYAFVNSSFCQIVKLTAAEILGKTPAEITAQFPRQGSADTTMATKLGAQGLDHHESIMRTGRQLEAEDMYLGPEGSPRYYHTVKTAVFDAAGRIIGTQGILFDITQRKQAELALAHERYLLHTLLDTAPDGIYFKDRESRFIRCSKSQANVFQVNSPEAMIGKTDFDFFSEAHARPAYEAEQAIIRTGQPMIGLVEKEVWKDGRETWVITSKMPLRDDAGEIIGTFGISKDITVIKQTEAKLESVHKQLLETSRAAGMAEVASNVLHNVGNVLNSVNVSATLVADNMKKSKATSLGRVVALLDEHTADLGAFITSDTKGKQLPNYLRQLSEHMILEQQNAVEELDSLRKNIEHIKDIVSMQQSYAKVSGHTEVLNITELIEDSLRMNAGALTRHDVQVVREYQEVPPINVEKHKVLQILVNLIRNAKYACDEGGRKPKLLTIRLFTNADHICVSVSDNGIGIPAENLTRIFNHGFTTRKDGHGFGLHSGALAAKEMGGTLNVQSAGPGTGATFTLELPRLKS